MNTKSKTVADLARSKSDQKITIIEDVKNRDWNLIRLIRGKVLGSISATIIVVIR